MGHSRRMLLQQQQVDPVEASRDWLGQVAAGIHVAADRVRAGRVGAGGCPPPVAGGDLHQAWLLKMDVALLPTIELPVTLVAPPTFWSLYKPPPLIVAQLFRMQLSAIVVVPLLLKMPPPKEVAWLPAPTPPMVLLMTVSVARL